MAVVPFVRTRRSDSGQGKRPLPPDLQARLRRLMDRYQVLALTHPLVATWLLEWLERFIGNHVGR